MPALNSSPPEAHSSPPIDSEDDEYNDMEYEPATETTEDESLDEEANDEEVDEDDEEDEDGDEDTEYLGGLLPTPIPAYLTAMADAMDSLGSNILDAEEEVEAEAFIEELLEAGVTETEAESEQDATPDDNNSTPTTAPRTTQPVAMTITRHELLQLLARSGAIRLFRPGPGPTEDDTDDAGYGRRGGRRKPQRNSDAAPKVPSENGRMLMESGVFGTNERDDARYERKKKLASRIMRRELGLDSPGKQRVHNRITSQELIPSSNADTIVHYDTRCYSGSFSDDGNFFFTCTQDFKVRMYDTSNPYNWRHYRTVNYPMGQWTITDATLSPDNKFLAYSSLKSTVCLAHTDPEQDSEPYTLDLSYMGRRRTHHNGRSHFGTYSIRFSGDGTELVAGTGENSVYVYDLETRQSILRISGHREDVNAVCYGDKMSPHILYSGSDDTTIKVWDRRSLGDQREAGVFLGHTEGITYVDSKGDGRYVLSNGKDQTMKLWDLRKMVSTDRAEQINPADYSTLFDYRFEEYREDYNPHPHDCSVVTFRGHRVLKTLIRCHFSPPGSTDSRYVYTGSEDGSIYIYNLDATLAGKIDVEKATHNSRPRGGEDPGYFYFDDGRGGRSWKTCVRDCSWHPEAPVVSAIAWNGYGMMYGTCTVHTWNDGLDDDEAEPGMGHRVNAELKPDRRLHDYQTPNTGSTRSRWSMRRRQNEDD